MNVDVWIKNRGWDGKFFLLTRDHTVEITTVGGDYGDVPIAERGSLFFYSNQVLVGKPKEEVDAFGRNYIDQVFIALCGKLHSFVDRPEPNKKAFHSLTTRKDGDRYMVRVRYDDVDLEMEVVEMFHYFTEKLKEGK